MRWNDVPVVNFRISRREQHGRLTKVAVMEKVGEGSWDGVEEVGLS